MEVPRAACVCGVPAMSFVCCPFRIWSEIEVSLFACAPKRHILAVISRSPTIVARRAPHISLKTPPLAQIQPLAPTCAHSQFTHIHLPLLCLPHSVAMPPAVCVVRLRATPSAAARVKSPLCLSLLSWLPPPASAALISPIHTRAARVRARSICRLARAPAQAPMRLVSCSLASHTPPSKMAHEEPVSLRRGCHPS